MMKRSIISAVALFVCATLAAENLDTICRRVALEAPSLRAEAARLDADRIQSDADNSLAGPEADFDYKFAPTGEPNRWGVSVGQSFDWPGLYGARRKSNRLRAGAMRQLHEQNVLDKALELKLAALSLAQARENHALMSEAAKNFEELHTYLQGAFDRGATTILALRKSELQLVAMRTALADAEAAVVRAEASLNAIQPGCLDSFRDIVAITPSPLRPETVYAEAFDTAPLTGAKQGELDAARNDISVARRSGLPSFKLSYAHDFEDGNHFNGFGISVALPSWQPKKTVDAARARALAADFDMVDYTTVQRARNHANYQEASRLYARISDESKALEGDYPALLKKAFDSGILNIFDYITEYNAYLDILSAHKALVARYAEIEARLAKSIR